MLAGQPELGERLEEPELRQLKQRVTLRCELAPFDVADTAAYIASRIRTAGGVAVAAVHAEAVMLIHECSGGIPRSINVICDNALLGAMAIARPRVDRAIVAEVCRDLRLAGVSSARRASPSAMQRAPPVIQADQTAEPEAAGAIDENTAPSTPPRRRFGLRFGARPGPGQQSNSYRMSRIDKALRPGKGPPARRHQLTRPTIPVRPRAYIAWRLRGGRETVAQRR